jgi:hypothetical protein
MSDAEGGVAEEPSCVYVLSAETSPPGPHFNPIGCFSLASSPQSAKFKSVLKDRMTPRELVAFASASASVR